MKSCTKIGALVFALSLGCGLASAASSADYSFDYSVTGLGGGASSSASYEMVAYADQSGSACTAASTTYSMEPAVGTPSAAISAVVSDWSLYN
jgi:hypothetical protein